MNLDSDIVDLCKLCREETELISKEIPSEELNALPEINNYIPIIDTKNIRDFNKKNHIVSFIILIFLIAIAVYIIFWSLFNIHNLVFLIFFYPILFFGSIFFAYLIEGNNIYIRKAILFEMPILIYIFITFSLDLIISLHIPGLSVVALIIFIIIGIFAILRYKRIILIINNYLKLDNTKKDTNSKKLKT